MLNRISCFSIICKNVLCLFLRLMHWYGISTKEESFLLEKTEPLEDACIGIAEFPNDDVLGIITKRDNQSLEVSRFWHGAKGWGWGKWGGLGVGWLLRC